MYTAWRPRLTLAAGDVQNGIFCRAESGIHRAAHRYRPGTGFANPSVYCPDLMRLIGHISDTMRADIAGRLERKAAG
jgi:hypothetical protein